VALAAVASTYTCSGLTNDQASYDGTPGTNVRSSAQVLSLLASTIPNFPASPQLAIDISPTVPATATAGTPFNAAFEFSAALPASLVTGAQALGLTSVTATNATFNIGVTGGTPSTLSSFVASQTVALVAGAKVTHAVTGSVAGSGSVVTYQPGNVTLGLGLDVNVLATHIGTISVSCVASRQDLASTTITGVGPTTTTAGPTTTTPGPTTTTVGPTTTTAAPTTTPTTPGPTTTTVGPTTTTTAAPTTTTTTVPSTPGHGAHHHRHHHRWHHWHWHRWSWHHWHHWHHHRRHHARGWFWNFDWRD
jgi:hypothetical protein